MMALRSRIRRAGLLARLAAPVLLTVASQAASAEPTPVAPSLLQAVFARPAEIPSPADNPLSAAKARLGKRLFSDQRLSGDRTRSCASCHRPGHAFTEPRPRALARTGEPLRRNTPHLYDLAWAKLLYWDGRADGLEAQARIPIVTHAEMGGDLATIATRLNADPRTAAAFARAFPRSPRATETTILQALASYERTLVSPRTRFDRHIAGETKALTATERAGLAIFMGRGQCVTCHGGWRFTDDKFHDIGLRSEDPGRGAIAGGVAGLPAFKTPSLRQVSRTAPYMHDGSLATLQDVVAHYSDNVIIRSTLATNVVRALRLSPDEKKALVAFLSTL